MSGRDTAPLQVRICVVAFIAGLVVSTMFAVATYAATGARAEDDPTIAVIAATLLGTWLGSAGILFWGYSKRGDGFADFVRGVGLKRPSNWWWVVGGPVVGLLSQLILVAALYAPLRELAPDVYDRLDDPAQSLTADGTTFITQLILIVLVAGLTPLFEELLFRGAILSSLTNWKGKWVGIFGSALWFGAAHGQPLQFPALFLFGLVLALMTNWSKSIWPAVATHSVFNLITLIVLFWG